MSADLDRVTVTVVYCAPDMEDICEVSLPPGSTVGDAVEMSGVTARHPALRATVDAGVWGRRCSLDRVLTAGDRVEIYRPLSIDPKEARRLRADMRRKRIKP